MTRTIAAPGAHRDLGDDGLVTAEPLFHQFYGTKMRADTALRSGESPRVTHHRIIGDGFALEDLAVEGDLEIAGDGPSKVVVAWISAGRMETHIRGAVFSAGAGEVMVGSTGTTPFRVRMCDAKLKTVVLDRSLLEALADTEMSTVAGSMPASPYLGSLVPQSADAARLWTRTHTYVADVVSDGGIVSPLVSANCARLLAFTAVAVFGRLSARSDGARHADGIDLPEYPAMLRKAMAYIEAHARYDVGVNDIASAVYLTPRALQYMFRKHLDVTPMAYLRRIRLEHVHAELVRSNRRTTTVSTAAARWGFAHTGRFAVLYRETYGRSPHVTLRE